MMKARLNIVFLTLMIFSSYTSQTQESQRIDSLKQILPFRNDDSLKVSYYADIAYYYITHNKNLLDTAKSYVDTIKQISTRLNHKYGTVLSDLYYGMIDRREGKYYQGIDKIKEFVIYHEERGDSSRVAVGLYNIGVMHYNLGNYEEALINYQRTLNIHKQNNNDRRIAQLQHSIGHLQRKMGLHVRAIDSYKNAIEVWKRIDNVTGLSMSTESLGNTFGELKRYSLSERYLLEALDIVNAEKRAIGIASVNENLGNLYGRMENYRASLKHHLIALGIRKSMSSHKNIAVSLTKVGNLYQKLNNLDLAKEYLTESNLIAKKYGFKPVLEQNYKALSEYYTARKDYKNALKNYQLYSKIKDSILNIERSKQLLKLETKYETAAKNDKIALLTKEKEIEQAKAEKQANIKKALLGTIFFLSIIAALVYFNMRQRVKNEKILIAKNEEIKFSKLREKLSSLEMKALRVQMNPHFLFNSMNSINRMILEGDNDNANKYLAKFSKLVRQILENSEANKVTLKDELFMLKTYIEMEAMRFKSNINYNLQVDETVDIESIQIPSMILQPFVENAIWHGLIPKKSGELLIKITDKEGYLGCTIKDDGIGRAASAELKKNSGLRKKSLGIKITTERLRLLTKDSIKNFIHIIDLKDNHENPLGTQVDILIPIS